ncbi:hypothetical protein NO2_0779 [Candidatus Termititenax persephonae]|uniref:Lipoprotein n=1 Tax=Candidatus Termititenax persephonae TaxID=2218525 RepID=A0A388TGH4_9BACT|nr:hypothetical protein NO2_0779 [Candidatus Termititenax persephonae]
MAALVLVGCGTDRAKGFVADAEGVFAGVVPAADDSGIAMTLNIKNGAYILSTKFITKQKEPAVTSGPIVYVRKNVLQIGNQQYKIKTDLELRLLDTQGKDIKSKFNYSLRRV